MNRERPDVRGAVVDTETRCIHYSTELDVIAIRFFCCGEFYPCHLCHEEAVDHQSERWPIDRRNEPAVLCGRCGHVLTVGEYGAAETCPSCGGMFNPGCKLHWNLYFDPDPGR